MAWHLYLLPMIDSGNPRMGRVPKYILGVATSAAVSPFGFQGDCLCAADVTNPLDAAIASNPDASKIPDNLDATLGAGAVATVQGILEARNIPAQWVTGALTWRRLLRIVWAIFTFVTRFATVNQITTAFLSGGITLDTTFASLSAQNRQRLLDTAADMNFNTDGFTGASTLRQILKGVADQWGEREFELGGIRI